MPLIEFRATNIFNAFVLNSMVSALVIIIAMTIHRYMDPNTSIETNTTEWKGVVVTLIFTFISSLAAYSLMYFLFGFGHGMLA
jgi:hypothetical protein